MAESLDSLRLASELKANILLVDDNPANLLALRSLLEHLGHNLLEARCGEEAIEQVKNVDVAVVLLDVLMPTISGFETAKAIRGQNRSQHTPIIFLTASDIDRSQMEVGYALGAVDFLVKPILPVAIQAKVRGFVQLFQDKLRATNEADQFRLLIEGAKDYAIFRLDPQGYVASWNPGAERIKQYRAEEIIGQHFSRFYPQDAIERGWPAHELTVAKAEGRFEDEGWRLRKDGTQFWGNVVITALYDDTGRFRGFSKITRDMTERKKAEENARRLVEEAAARRVAEENARLIQEQRERLHVTLASIGDGVISTDAEGKVDYLNPVAETLVGWTTEDATHRSLSDVFRIVNEETRLPVENPALRALQEGGVVGLANHTLLIARDGTERPIDDCAAPIRDIKGNVVGSVLVFRDISEKKRGQQVVRESEGRFRGLSEQAPFSIQVFTPDGRTVQVNRAWEELWGLTLDQIADYNVLEDPQLEAKGILPYLRRAFAGEPTTIPGIQYDPNLTIPSRTKHQDPVRWVAAMAYPLKDETGEVREVVLVHEDITARKRAEAALEESEEKLRLLADTIPQLAWMARPDGHIFWYNRRSYEYTGMTQAQLDGWGWQALLDPDRASVVLDGWRGAIASGDPFEMVFDLKGADGQFRPFLTRVNPLKAEDGRVRYWFGTNTDIADQKRAEIALRESEQRFRQLADAMPQIVWRARPNGEIDYHNRRWYEFTGLSNTVGNDGWGQILYPDDAPPARERWAASVRSGAPFEMEVRLLDRRQQSYRWHLIRTVAVHDDAGAIAHWFGTSTDIDGQKRAEESSRFLAEASAALAGVVDYESTLQKVANLAVPYFADWSAVDVLNDDGTLRRLTVAHKDSAKIGLAHELMKQYPPDPQAAGGVFAVLRTGKPEIVSEITGDMLVQGTKDERHLHLIRSLGLRSYICMPLIVSGDALGVLTFATAESGRLYTDADLALANDLANRAGVAIENFRLYEALRDADRRKDEFLATLAHELRNPLAPIHNSLQILKMPRIDAAMVEQSREMMERQVNHLVRLVDDLLDVSRVMRGKIELRKERIELATVVARAVETVQPLVDAQGHQLSVRLPNESLLLDADPVRLTQVVGNLLTNAAKYTEANGRIWLTAERSGDEAVLRVSDNGIGITPIMLPRIFDLFVQADHTSTKAQGGLGIGLTLVKNLVQMHSGGVEAKSAGLGQGSEFVVRLPIAVQAIAQAHVGERGQQQPAPTPSGHRLLIVDDNMDAANSLAMLLKLQGHEVRVAHNGPAALEITKGYTPDVVFLDIGMPGMDGYEVARQMRQQPGLEYVVLAALTGWGQKEDLRRTAEAGFDHHLVKPPEPKAVEKLLADLSDKTGRQIKLSGD